MTPRKSDPKIGLISNGMISSGCDPACVGGGESACCVCCWFGGGLAERDEGVSQSLSYLLLF